MSSLFNNYKRYLVSTEEFNRKVNSGEYDRKKYISLSAQGSLRKHYMEIRYLNQFLEELWHYYSELDPKSTDPNFNVNINDCYNVMYIDADYYYSIDDKNDIEQIDNFNTTFADCIIDLIRDRYPKARYFLFLPDTYDCEHDYMAKGGIHMFVFLDKPIRDKRSKADMIREMVTNCEDILDLYNEHKEFIVNEAGQPLDLIYIIDPQPLMKAGTLLPFAQKSKTSRKYKLSAVKLNKDGIEDPTELIIECDIDSVPSYTDIINEQSDLFNFKDLSVLSTNKIKEVILDQTYYDSITAGSLNRIQWGQYTPSQVAKIKKIEAFLFDFTDGLGTLDDRHYFYVEFGSWNDRRKFELRFVKFYIALLVYEVGVNTIFEDKIIDRVVKLLTPVYVRLGKYNSTEKQQTIDWCTKMIKYNSKGEEHYYYTCIQECGDLFSEYKHTPKGKEANNLIKTQVEEYNKGLDPSEHISIGQMLQKYQVIMNFITTSFSKWSSFVNKHILKQIRYEIEPFDWKNYTRGRTGLTFEDVLPIINKRGDEIEGGIFKKSEYIRQLRNLNKMFLFTMIYERGVNIVSNVIGEIMTAYIKSYVVCAIDDKSNARSGYQSIYIYNIRQTEDLDKYPYNQWIIDEKDNLKNWIFVIYKNLFEPLTNKSKASKHGGIEMMTDILQACNFVGKPSGQNTILSTLQSPFNYKNCTNVLTNCIIATYKSERHLTPRMEDPESSSHFGMRNGIIQWKNLSNDSKKPNWICTFSTQNRGIMLGAYTLINYIDPETYDKKSKEYKTMTSIIEQIYPLEDERNYMLDLFSTVICPIIKKDQMLIVFGSGGDGKSTMDLMLTSMLGYHQKNSRDYYENGEKITLQAPEGYAGNMESSTFTHSKGQTSGHDEGGKVNVAKKTFVVCQEPEKGKQLVTSVIKDLTSGSVSHGRKIHQAEITFVNNSLMVMETNSVLKYDTIDDAVRRRMVIYKHQSKFVTEVNEEQMKDVKYKFRANSDLINKVVASTEYWDALFQILLEHALGILNRGCYVISNIKPPKSVVEFTNLSFDNASPLVTYLNSRYEQFEESLLFVEDVINGAIEYAKTNEGVLEKTTRDNLMRSEIVSELQKKYNGRFYRLNKEIYHTPKGTLKRNWRQIFEDHIKEKTITEIIDEETDGNGALTDISMDSKLKYSNLIIRGYREINDDDEE